MPTNKQVYLSLFSFLIVSIFFLAVPETGHSGTSVIPVVGCCISGDTCVGCESGCAISTAECTAFGGTFSDTDAICVDKGAGADCADPADNAGCCQIADGECLDEQIDYFTCTGEAGGIAWFLGTDCSEVPQCGESTKASNIPALGEWGMIALVVVLGIAGLIYYTRRRRMNSV